MPAAFLTALVCGRPEHQPDAQGEVLRVEGDKFVFEHEDGSQRVYFCDELLKAIEDAQAA